MSAASADRGAEWLDAAAERMRVAAPANNEPPWPDPIDEAAYHGIAGDLVRTIEPHTEADSVALLVQFLVAAGNLIGRSPHYRVEGDSHHTNLFTVIVGASAKARKGTSVGRVRQVLSMVADDPSHPWDKQCVQSGMSSGEGVIHAVRDGDGDDDPGVTDKRLMLLESEFAGLLRVMAREGNIVSRIVRDAWDRGDLGVLTKSCPTVATGAHISIIGHITADELRRYLDRTEAANGFANRFLFVVAKRSKFLPHGGALSDADLRGLAARLSPIIDRARQIEQVRMDDSGRAAWEAIYPALSADQPGMFGSVTARAEAQTLRLAMLYALLDGEDSISVVHLRAACALWEYSSASARYVFGDATGDPLADRIMAALAEAAANGMTRTDIHRLGGRHHSADAISRALETLRTAGRIVQRAVSTGGRPAEYWFVAGIAPDPDAGAS